MIILPSGGHQYKAVAPMRRKLWLPPSLSQEKDCTGRPNDLHWEVRAFRQLDDGYRLKVWEGWFFDREDWDSFAWSLTSGSLANDRYIRGLPASHVIGPNLEKIRMPGFDPAILEEPLVWEFLTTQNLTSGPGSNQTWNVPADWSNTNSFECIGGGGGGKAGDAFAGAPGGGGAYSKKSNVTTLTPGGTTTYQLGSGGTAGTGARPNGGDTWIGATTFASSFCGAKGATGVTSSGVAGVGGAAASGIGDTKSSGGNGGENLYSGGSGSAAGPNGAGKNGGASGGSGAGGGGGGNGGGTAGSNGSIGGCCAPDTGGNGGNNSGGSGGGSGSTGAGSAGTNGGGGGGGGSGAKGGAGGSGTEWTTHGSGGGGGGNGAASGTQVAGGSYGAGSTGAASGATAAAGIQGMIHIEYVEATFIGWSHTISVPVRRILRPVRY